MNGPTEKRRALGRLEASDAYRLARGEWLPSLVRHSRVDLRWGRHAAYGARQAIVEQFGEILSAEEQDVLRLLASELVNNAVEHGRAGPGHHVILHLAVSPERMRVEVCDGGPGFDPRALPERDGRAGGNGLLLIDRIASRWGVATDKGTCVWFELDR